MLKVRQKNREEVYAWQFGMDDSHEYIQFLLNSGYMLSYTNNGENKPHKYIIDNDDGEQLMLPGDWLVILDVITDSVCGKEYIDYIECVVLKDDYFKNNYEILEEI